MIPCRELIEFLDDYVADALAPDVRATFEAHLAACPPCQDYLRTYRDAIRLGQAAMADLDAAAPASVPEPLVRAILAARKTGA